MTLPSYAYGDPADVVEREQLRRLGCRACKHHAVHFERVVCTNGKVTNHKRVPRIGTKCKQFELKG